MVQGQLKQIKTVMIMAAGTGGHVFPALAVAEKLRAQGVDVHWLATRAGMEHRLVGSRNIPLHPIDIQGLRGNGLKRLIAAPFKIMAATLAAMRLMRKLNIDAVIGFGGYVAGPGGLAARLLGLPLVIHEQNAIAGFTNTQLARLSTLVLQAFPNTFAESAKVKTTGNPVRADIASLPLPEVRYAERGNLPLNILVVGGSLGAQALNERIPEALAGLNIPLNVMHQCGQQQVQATQQRYDDLASSQLAVQVVPFVEDMANAYARADLMICRAGALTVTEVATAGVAAVFVPLPSAVDDHQTANARYLVDCEAALLCPQASLTSESLMAALQPIMKRATLQAMAQKARQQAHPQATQQVCDLLLALSSRVGTAQNQSHNPSQDQSH
ncbi:MAG: undecaprenyldiphospho-muramoylpentapeptide beta-N-acetylglucosaminyltransferase [Moraxellaceae bacterium]|nr:MAG: undecaprenyldiphospho-muramoylpentapeptide beta-N-acetylglucosaminyltransferase [Moraxellaceae bacterium]